MYKLKFSPIIIFIGFIFLLSVEANSKDLNPTTVFDLTLGQPFTVRECNYEVLENEIGMEGIAAGKRNRGLFGKPDHTSKIYRYTEVKPSADKCFQRVGPFYTSMPPPGLSLPPTTPPNNQKVKLIYSDGLRPAIADSEDIWVGIQDTRLTGIRFYFQTRNEQRTFQVLLQKYGHPASNEKYTLQTPTGTLKTFYSAKWEFPRLEVTFLSLDTNQIGYDPQDAPIGYLSEVGSVTVQYKIQEASTTDNNPL